MQGYLPPLSMKCSQDDTDTHPLRQAQDAKQAQPTCLSSPPRAGELLVPFAPSSAKQAEPSSPMQHFKDLAVEDENLHQLVSDQRTEISNLKDVILGLQSELAASRAAEAGTSDKLASALGFSCAPSDSRQLVATRTRSHSAANGGTFQSQRQSPTPSLSSSTMTLDTSVSQSGPETYAQSLHSGRQQMNTEAPAFVKYPQPGASLNDGFATCQTLPAEDGDQSGFTLWQPQTIPPLFDLQAQAFAYPVPPPYSSLSEANKLNLIGQPITPQGY